MSFVGEWERQFYRQYFESGVDLTLPETSRVLFPHFSALEHDRSLLQNPETLAFARFFLADLIRISISSDRSIDSILDLNQKWGSPLLPDDLQQLKENKVIFPLPYSTQRAEYAPVPEQYDNAGAVMDLTIEDYARDNCLIGLTTGCFDIIHAGHLRFLQETTLWLIQQAEKEGKWAILIVGVDDNQLVAQRKGPNRPFNDFSVRVGSLSGIAGISYIFRVSHGLIASDKPNGYMPFPISSLPLNTIVTEWDEKNIVQAQDQIRRSCPDWFTHVGPNIIHFLTQTDPMIELKQKWIQIIGGRSVAFPKFTKLSSTLIAEQFQIQQSYYQPNGFKRYTGWTKR